MALTESERNNIVNYKMQIERYKVDLQRIKDLKKEKSEYYARQLKSTKDVATKANVLTRQDVAVQIIEYLEMRNLHKQYAIDSVPTTVIADNLGVVQYGVLGPITATDLWAAMARCRDPKVLTD